jgi:hypothetical protein
MGCAGTSGAIRAATRSVPAQPIAQKARLGVGATGRQLVAEDVSFLVTVGVSDLLGAHRPRSSLPERKPSGDCQ